MTKVLTFKVWINGLENKIWRKIEITDCKTVADLAYTILASFDSLAYHIYNIKHNNKRYSCMILPEDYWGEELTSAITTKLRDLDFSDDKMVMKYDFVYKNTFVIHYLESRDLERVNGRHYPYIVDGAGRGMLDDMYDFKLKEIVDDIDKKGYSDHCFTAGYERNIKYDYRQYNIKDDNILLKGLMLEIKENYESL